VLYGLAKIGMRYKDFPVFFVNTTHKTLLKVIPNMNEQEVANTVYSYVFL
jgi:hypothetical protein